MDESSETPTSLDRQIIQEIDFPDRMNSDLVEQWQDIPKFDKADPTKPEWQPTPLIPVEIQGFGQIHIKNEADKDSNRTGTVKDRAAWELAGIYRDFARQLEMDMREGSLQAGDLEKYLTHRFSLITSGNEGRAIAQRFAEHGLPPPKLILGQDTPTSVIEELKKERADIYLVDLSAELSPEDILKYSNNTSGVVTSEQRPVPWLEPQAVFYDWHVHEAFNENPDEIYVPYGSGRLMENYLYWQARTVQNRIDGKPDPRLRGDPSRVAKIDVFGGEPQEMDSVADKLTAQFKPFLIFKDRDIGYLLRWGRTGQNTKVYRKQNNEGVPEDRIQEAHQMLAQNGIEAEPSGAVGLALFLDRNEKGQVPKDKKILVVNSGKGLEAVSG